MASTNMTTLVEMIAPICQSGDVFKRNGYDGMICSQNSTPVTKRLACMSQMWTSWFSSAASKSGGEVPQHHDGVEGDQRRPRVDDEPPEGAPRRATAAEQERAQQGAASGPDRQPVQQGQPGCAGHDQERRVEGDQDVLDHVHEEVVVGPVVDRRRDREQEQRQAGVEEERPETPASGSGPGPSAAAGWPGRARGGRRRARRRPRRGRSSSCRRT